MNVIRIVGPEGQTFDHPAERVGEGVRVWFPEEPGRYVTYERHGDNWRAADSNHPDWGTFTFIVNAGNPPPVLAEGLDRFEAAEGKA